MNKNILIGIIAVLVIVAGGWLFFGRQTMKDNMKTSSIGATKEDGEVMTKEGYSGQLLAGDSSPFLTFNKGDYDKAIAEGKIVFLDFYANWCPICRAEAPVIHEGFNNLEADTVVGFRVNFNDSDTDSDEEALAKEFSVPYQHTKIILKDGKEVFRDLNSWSGNDFADAIGGVI